jgi:hypothetical protein
MLLMKRINADTALASRSREFVFCYLNRDVVARVDASPSGSSQKSRPATRSLHAIGSDPQHPQHPRNPFVSVASPSGS